jgi:hypothetical protein
MPNLGLFLLHAMQYPLQIHKKKKLYLKEETKGPYLTLSYTYEQTYL